MHGHMNIKYFDNITSIINEENTQTPVLENQTTPVLLLADNLATGPFNTLRTGLLNCLNARSRGLIQSEVRLL